MTVVHETLAGFISWVQKPEKDEDRILSGTALKTQSFVYESSVFVRSAVSGYDAIYKLKAPPSFSALGFTSGFSLVTGALGLRKGVNDYKKRVQNQDRSGAALGGMGAAGGALQMVGGATFIASKSLNTAAYITESKGAKAVADIFGKITGGAFEVGALLLSLSLLIKIYDAYSIVEECLDREPAESLASFRYKLQDPGYRSSMVRITSEACVGALEGVNPNEAEAVRNVIDRIYHESSEAMLSPLFSLTLIGLGIAASMIVTVTTAPTALLVATGINGFLAIFGFATALTGFIKTLRKNEAPGRYDQLLLAALGMGCLFSLGMTRFYHDSREAEIIIGALGLVWLAANAAAYRKLRR